MRKFYLIKNSGGLTYWSYKVGREAAKWLSPMLAQAVMRYGDIYVNRNGGWMTASCISEVLKVVEQDDFPPEA